MKLLLPLLLLLQRMHRTLSVRVSLPPPCLGIKPHTALAVPQVGVILHVVLVVLLHVAKPGALLADCAVLVHVRLQLATIQRLLKLLRGEG